MDDLAFIVNVKDRLVVTAMDTHSKNGEGVFTQIDTVVFADASNKSTSTSSETDVASTTQNVDQNA